jgi:competence protein ComEA
MTRVLIALGAALALGLAVWLHPVRPAPAAAGGFDAARPPQREPPSRAPAAHAVVYVAGEVVHPGVYSVAADERIAAVVARAGGMRPGADPTAVNLAAHVHDGDEILVLPRGAAAPAHAHRRRSAGPRRRAHGRRGATRHGAPGAPVDINRADAATLAAVPGMGPGLAERIVAFRAANGPFTSTDELLDVSGITDRRLDAMLPYVIAR